MYIKILIYIIDNQQFKWKISIPFWLAGVCRSFFPPFVDWGGRSKKTADPTARFRGGGPSRISRISRISPQSRNPAYPAYPAYPSYPAIPHIPAIPHTSTCDAHPNISLISPSNPFIVPSRPFNIIRVCIASWLIR